MNSAAINIWARVFFSMKVLSRYMHKSGIEPLYRKETHGHGEQTCGCQRGRGGSGMDWDSGVSRFTLLHLEWISNKILLYSPGNYYLVTCGNMMGDNVRKRIYIIDWVALLYSRN